MIEITRCGKGWLIVTEGIGQSYWTNEEIQEASRQGVKFKIWNEE